MKFPSRLRPLLLHATTFLLASGGSAARADLTFYSTLSSFAADNANLPTETFESAQVNSGSFAVVAGPVTSTTNDGVFSTGNIQSGISFASVGANANTNLVVTGSGTTPGGSKALGTSAGNNAMEITLANSSAIGMNVFASVGPNSVTTANFLVQVYGASGLLGSETVSSSGVNGFFGVSAGSTAITKVDITESGATASTFVDNVTFGKPTPGTTYSDRAAFMLAHPGLSTEGFEAAQVNAGGYVATSSPLSSTSNNGLFPTGGFLPGLTIASVGSDANTGLVITGTGTTTGGTKEVGVIAYSNAMELTCSQAQSAVGFTLLASSGPGSPGSSVFSVSIYGASGLIETDQVTVSGLSTFFGVAETQGITRIDIANTATTSSVFIDDISFSAASVPEPSSLAMAGIGLASALIYRRSRGSRAGGH